MEADANRKSLGKRGEDATAAFLVKRGCRIVARNYRSREGEIDLVAQDGEFLAFVEVKTRSSSTYGFGREAVTLRKQEKIIRTALHFLAENHPQEPPPCRFDVAEVEIYRGEIISIEYYEAAFIVSGT